ncbi:hypothetical protein [Pseudomonas alabamensis]|uniref:hypothetical protein n=1 Tax=Pseudomonas alabamensis TaxID=3064349 RepID=UPI003D160B79
MKFPFPGRFRSFATLTFAIAHRRSYLRFFLLLCVTPGLSGWPSRDWRYTTTKAQRRREDVHIGVPLETQAGEARVAATPETIKKLVAQGHRITVQRGGRPSGQRCQTVPTKAAGATLAALRTPWVPNWSSRSPRRILRS